MKAILTAMVLMVSAQIAHADGFVCTSESGLVIRAYNHTTPEEGTRSAAILVISDSKVSGGRKTIATFSDAKSTLKSMGVNYHGKVDLRVKESNRGGELIAGTKLAYLSRVILSVDFSFRNPVEAGTELSGQFSVEKRNGDQVIEAVNCTRYLKN